VLFEILRVAAPADLREVRFQRRRFRQGMCRELAQLQASDEALASAIFNERQHRFADSRAMQRSALADGREHPDALRALDLVDVHHLRVVEHRQVHCLACLHTQAQDLVGGRGAHVQLLPRLLRHFEGAKPHAIALVARVHLEEAMFHESAEQAVQRRLGQTGLAQQVREPRG
jgi:hypothetical protein